MNLSESIKRNLKESNNQYVETLVHNLITHRGLKNLEYYIYDSIYDEIYKIFSKRYPELYNDDLEIEVTYPDKFKEIVKELTNAILEEIL